MNDKTRPSDKTTYDANRATISYDEAKVIARDGLHQERRELAVRRDMQPEILYFLTDDPDPEVRRLLASNPAAPRHADLVLARDQDDQVRSDLAKKMAELAPGLSPDEADKIGTMTYQALQLLARDQVVRVRQILSEALKDIADAPADVIRHLAEDAELVVAAPVLQFSPVLSDTDLLEIISKNAKQDRLHCIANRENIGESIVDMILEKGDVPTIALLLANDSAQLREQALDDVIERSKDTALWHKPLVHRSFLPDHAALKLAQFVADSLLNALLERDDLSADTLKQVRVVVDQRLQETGAPADAEQKDDERTPAEIAFDKARQLFQDQQLPPGKILDALENGNDDFVIAALAVRAELDPMAVRKTIADKNVKGLLAIAWTAGLSAIDAAKIQKQLAKLPDNRIINPNSEGRYALGDDDMEWQLEFVRERG